MTFIATSSLMFIIDIFFNDGTQAPDLANYVFTTRAIKQIKIKIKIKTNEFEAAEASQLVGVGVRRLAAECRYTSSNLMQGTMVFFTFIVCD